RDLEDSLRDLAGRVGARRVLLWRIERAADRARAVATSGGPLPAAPAPLRGSPLGWAWEEGVQMQIDPPPAWAAADALVVACRLRTEGSDGTLLTYEFGKDHHRPAAVVLDSAAATVRAVLVKHYHQTSSVAVLRRCT